MNSFKSDDDLSYSSTINSSKKHVERMWTPLTEVVALAEMSYVTYLTSIKSLIDANLLVKEIIFVPNRRNLYEQSSRQDLKYHGILYTTPELYERAYKQLENFSKIQMKTKVH